MKVKMRITQRVTRSATVEIEIKGLEFREYTHEDVDATTKAGRKAIVDYIEDWEGEVLMALPDTVPPEGWDDEENVVHVTTVLGVKP